MTAPTHAAIRQLILDAVDQDPEVRVWFTAKLDAFAAAVRRTEDAYIATTLRAAAADPEYDLHDVVGLERIADQIERFRG